MVVILGIKACLYFTICNKIKQMRDRFTMGFHRLALFYLSSSRAYNEKIINTHGNPVVQGIIELWFTYVSLCMVYAMYDSIVLVRALAWEELHI